MKIIKSTEYNNRTRNLNNYFSNIEKWKENEYGELLYYKGKRNLIELKLILDLVFGDVIEIFSEDFYKDSEEKIVGGSITCRIYVDADFNGANQGTAGADVFVRYTLIENGYFTEQASKLEGL